MISQLLTSILTSQSLIPYPAQFSASPDARVPCVFVLDRSTSMFGDKIDQLNAAMSKFGKFIRSDKLTAANTEFAVVSFGGDVRIEVPFMPGAEFQAPVLVSGGGTPLGSGLLKALQLLNERLATYRRHDVENHLPWLMVISDGEETESQRECAKAGLALRKLEGARLIRSYVVAVDGADMVQLQTLTSGRPIALRELSFEALFAWLYRSLRTASANRPGEGFEPQDPFRAGWAK